MLFFFQRAGNVFFTLSIGYRGHALGMGGKKHVQFVAVQ
jgi:hypothetical protein